MGNGREQTRRESVEMGVREGGGCRSSERCSMNVN